MKSSNMIQYFVYIILSSYMIPNIHAGLLDNFLDFAFFNAPETTATPDGSFPTDSAFPVDQGFPTEPPFPADPSFPADNTFPSDSAFPPDNSFPVDTGSQSGSQSTAGSSGQQNGAIASTISPFPTEQPFRPTPAVADPSPLPRVVIRTTTTTTRAPTTTTTRQTTTRPTTTTTESLIIVPERANTVNHHRPSFNPTRNTAPVMPNIPFGGFFSNFVTGIAGTLKTAGTSFITDSVDQTAEKTTTGNNQVVVEPVVPVVPPQNTNAATNAGNSLPTGITPIGAGRPNFGGSAGTGTVVAGANPIPGQGTIRFPTQNQAPTLNQATSSQNQQTVRQNLANQATATQNQATSFQNQATPTRNDVSGQGSSGQSRHEPGGIALGSGSSWPQGMGSQLFNPGLLPSGSRFGQAPVAPVTAPPRTTTRRPLTRATTFAPRPAARPTNSLQPAGSMGQSTMLGMMRQMALSNFGKDRDLMRRMRQMIRESRRNGAVA